MSKTIEERVALIEHRLGISYPEKPAGAGKVDPPTSSQPSGPTPGKKGDR